MYAETKPRKDRSGKPYYSIRYRDRAGKLKRLPKDKHPHFSTYEEAQRWAKSQVAIQSAKADEIQRKIAWKTQFYEFNDLLAKYRAYQQERAPNSWKSCVFYLEQWVFPFYLQERHVSNINDWYLFFEQFRLWLSDPEANLRKGRRQPLAVSTKNNIVKALNTFLKCLGKHNLIDPGSVRECEAWGEHLVAKRGIEDVIQEDKMKAVYAKMRAIHEPSAEFFYVLWHTGMRFSELFGLPFNWLYAGEPKDGPLKTSLKRHGISQYGYIVLESQPTQDDRKREEDFSIARKPLKSCPEISARYFRTIPIRSKELWNILATRYGVQKAAFEARKYTADKRDYPLFDDLEWNAAYSTLAEAYRSLKLEPKEFHCCRHSFTTLLVGETNDFALVRMITGHRTARAFEKYLHIYEQIALQAKQNDQEIKIIA